MSMTVKHTPLWAKLWSIFNSFVIITLGSFGIDGVTKIFAKDKKEEEL